MQEWIIQTMNQFGYIGIMLLIAIENVFPPIPSEVILTFGGFSTTYTDMKVWGVIIAATVGAVIGALVLYSVGRFFPPERIEGWLDGRLGQMLTLSARMWSVPHTGLKKREESPFSSAALSRSSAA